MIDSSLEIRVMPCPDGEFTANFGIQDSAIRGVFFGRNPNEHGRSCVPGSEVQLQGYLHHPLRERGVDHARAGASSGNHGRSAQTEIRMVRRVEHFPPYLQIHLLLDRERSVYAHVEREQARAHYRVGTGIASCAALPLRPVCASPGGECTYTSGAGLRPSRNRTGRCTSRTGRGSGWSDHGREGPGSPR